MIDIELLFEQPINHAATRDIQEHVIAMSCHQQVSSLDALGHPIATSTYSNIASSALFDQL